MEQMVVRLNGLLAKYQANSCIDLDEEEKNSQCQVEAVRGLETDPRVIFPLIVEYDQQIDDFTTKNRFLAQKNEEYQDKIKELSGSNTVLMSELKQSIADRINSAALKGDMSRQDYALQAKEIKETLTEMLQKVEHFNHNSKTCETKNRELITKLSDTIVDHKSEIKQHDYENQVKMMTRKITKLTQKNEDIRKKYKNLSKENEKLFTELTTTTIPGHQRKVDDGLSEKVEEFAAMNKRFESDIQELEKDNSKLVKDVENAAVNLNISTVDYNEKLGLLNRKITELSSQHENLHDACEDARGYNGEMTVSMKKLVELVIETLYAIDNEPSGGGRPGTGDFDSPHGLSKDNDAVEILKRQLELCKQEKDLAIQLQEETMQELDNLRRGQLSETMENRRKEEMNHDLLSRTELLEKSNLNFHQDLQILQQENQTLSITITRQYDEINELKDKVRKGQEMTNSYNRREQEALDIAEKLKIRILKLEDERGEFEHRHRVNLKTIEQLEDNLCQSETKLAFETQKSSALTNEVAAIKKRVCLMERTKADIESKEFDYLSQIREGAQLLDDACLARDSSMVREKQLRDDLNKSSEAMKLLVEDVAQRIQVEVGKCRKQHQDKINRLMCEIETMTIEAANLKSEADRSKRARRNVENELENHVRQQKESAGNSKLSEYQHRMIAAERAKEDMEITLQAFENQLKHRKREFEDEKACFVDKKKTLEDKVMKLQDGMEDIMKANTCISQQLDQYKSNAQKFEDEARYCGLAATKKLAADRSVFERANKQLQHKITSLNTQNVENTRHLQQMVNDQQRVTARWREEASNCNYKYEDKMKDLQDQLYLNKRKCQELNLKLKKNDELYSSYEETSKENCDFETKINELESSNNKLRERLYKSDSKLLSATARVGELQSKNNESLYLCDHK